MRNYQLLLSGLRHDLGFILKEATGGEFRVYRASIRLL